MKCTREADIGHAAGLEGRELAARHGVGDARGRDGAAVGGEKVVGEALDADLHLGAAECAQAAAGIGGDEVGARFHHQPDDALRCRFVGAMQGEKGVPGAALQRLTLNAFP